MVLLKEKLSGADIQSTETNAFSGTFLNGNAYYK